MKNRALEIDDHRSDLLAISEVVSSDHAARSYDAPLAVSHITNSGLVVKRTMDLLIAVLGIIITVPLALMIAIAVKWSSPGPVLFTQERVGRDGHVFKILKFRTMRDGTHREVLESTEARARYVANDFKLPADDPRITSVGRWLRKSSIDELPQLINVLLGQMSLVGIRPIESAQLALRSYADQEIYESLRPGLTGIWQINGRSTMDSADRVTLDNRYVEEWSVWGDVKIMLRTPLAVLRLHHTH